MPYNSTNKKNSFGDSMVSHHIDQQKTHSTSAAQKWDKYLANGSQK